MVDAHCHLQEFNEEEMQSMTGLAGMICCGAGVESSRRAVEIAERYANVYATVGVHPEEASNHKMPNPNEFLNLSNHKKVVAIGECGLDYTPETDEKDKKEQKDLFRFNIYLARETKLPLVVHCRNAFEDVFEILDYDKVQMHCFTGNMAQMQKCVKRGWYISLGGILTFKNSHELREVAKAVPEDRLLVETDAPWLAPEPVRGTRNTPVNVKIVLGVLSEIRGHDMTEITTQNAINLFQLIPTPQRSSDGHLGGEKL